MAVEGEPFGELAGGGGFAGALQADDHPDGGRAGGEERLGVLAEERGELVANGFDHLLIGRKLQHDFATDGFLADVGKQLVGNTDVDIAFEEGFADFSESGVEVLVGEFALSAEVLEGALQLFGQVLKHVRLFSARNSYCNGELRTAASPGNSHGRVLAFTLRLAQEAGMALDWSQCTAVESVPGKVSGAWVFRGTRIPVAAVFENLEDGLTVNDIVEMFDGLRQEQV